MEEPFVRVGERIRWLPNLQTGTVTHYHPPYKGREAWADVIWDEGGVGIIYPSTHKQTWRRISEEPPSLASTLFELGELLMSTGVANKVATDAAFAEFVSGSLRRHARGDWGDLCQEDKRQNELALLKDGELFSTYEKLGMPKIWIITEADRSTTTIMFPEEY
jgi:hypothetical protein